MDHAAETGGVARPTTGWVPPDVDSLWKAMTTEPGTGVTVVRIDGRILFANDEVARFLVGPAAHGSTQIGRNLGELFPPEWVEERLGFLEKVATTGRPIVVRAIWNGAQGLSWWSRVKGRGAEADRVLIVTRRAGGEEAVRQVGPEVELVHSSTVQLGELDVLTSRELEVLALVGQGLSIKEIAACLSRSVKTISRHRDAIGKKLVQSDRVKLAEMAWRAGLTLKDAERTRL
jgi:DNA-binding CsgD family transcriptional regulator